MGDEADFTRPLLIRRNDEQQGDSSRGDYSPPKQLGTGEIESTTLPSAHAHGSVARVQTGKVSWGNAASHYLGQDGNINSGASNPPTEMVDVVQDPQAAVFGGLTPPTHSHSINCNCVNCCGSGGQTIIKTTTQAAPQVSAHGSHRHRNTREIEAEAMAETGCLTCFKWGSAKPEVVDTRPVPEFDVMQVPTISNGRQTGDRVALVRVPVPRDGACMFVSAAAAIAWAKRSSIMHRPKKRSDLTTGAKMRKKVIDRLNDLRLPNPEAILSQWVQLLNHQKELRKKQRDQLILDLAEYRKNEERLIAREEREWLDEQERLRMEFRTPLHEDTINLATVGLDGATVVQGLDTVDESEEIQGLRESLDPVRSPLKAGASSNSLYVSEAGTSEHLDYSSGSSGGSSSVDTYASAEEDPICSPSPGDSLEGSRRLLPATDWRQERDGCVPRRSTFRTVGAKSDDAPPKYDELNSAEEVKSDELLRHPANQPIVGSLESVSSLRGSISAAAASSSTQQRTVIKRVSTGDGSHNPFTLSSHSPGVHRGRKYTGESQEITMDKSTTMGAMQIAETHMQQLADEDREADNLLEYFGKFYDESVPPRLRIDATWRRNLHEVCNAYIKLMAGRSYFANNLEKEIMAEGPEGISGLDIPLKIYEAGHMAVTAGTTELVTGQDNGNIALTLSRGKVTQLPLFYHGGGEKGQHYDVMFVQTLADAQANKDWRLMADIVAQAARVTFYIGQPVSLRNFRLPATDRSPRGINLHGRPAKLYNICSTQNGALVHFVQPKGFGEAIEVAHDQIDNPRFSNLEHDDWAESGSPEAWASNSHKKCMVCDGAFGAARWKHHCRACGAIICSSLSCAKERETSAKYKIGGYHCKTCLDAHERKQFTAGRYPHDIFTGQLQQRYIDDPFGTKCGSASVSMFPHASQGHSMQGEQFAQVHPATDHHGTAVAIVDQACQRAGFHDQTTRETDYLLGGAGNVRAQGSTGQQPDLSQITDAADAFRMLEELQHKFRTKF